MLALAQRSPFGRPAREALPSGAAARSGIAARLTRFGQRNPWRLNKEFLAFIRAYLRTMPLAKSTIVDRSLQEHLLEGSQGNTQTVVKMLQRATKAAILDGSEQILLKHVEIIDGFAVAPLLRTPRRRVGKGRRLPPRAA